jgi:hypothetical protein
MLDQLIADGVAPLNFYDPGTSPAFGPVDWFGAVPFAHAADEESSFWTCRAPYPSPDGAEYACRITGYVQTFSGTGEFTDSIGVEQVATNVNQKLNTALGSVSQRTLLACATITPVTNNVPSDSYATFQSYTWAGIRNYDLIFNTNLAAKLLNSAHLQGRTPIGGNEAMLDGHVEWRPFQNMINRTGPSLSFYY